VTQTAEKNGSTNEVEIPLNAPSMFDTEALGEITSFEDAVRALSEAGVAAEEMSAYGSGFTVLDKKDKTRLVGEDFVILEWRFNDSKLSDEGFVSFSAVTKDGRKFVVNDGGTGIRRQLVSVTRKRQKAGHRTPNNGLMVRGGLTSSTYNTTDAEGRDIEATTYYLSEAPA
jgi:hypothetical protein